jgi:4-amino-4-deoxy-L-arabinose transferase-like glycosyltransferase
MESNPTESNPTRAERLLCPALFALALGLLAWILLRSFASAVKDPTSDDAYYLRYMQTVHADGLRAFPAMFEQWNATSADWIFPPPSRVGFIVVSGLWAGIFGTSLSSLQYLSFASHLLLCVVNYAFARRQLGEPRALFVGVLLAFSALLMGLSRLALTDSFNALCMTTTVWLFLELTSRPRSFAAGIPFMSALAFMVLVKELSVLLVVPFAAFVAYERFVRREPRDLARLALWFVLPGAVTVAVFVLAAGSPVRFLETARIVLASPATNTYAQSMGSGPWFRPVVDYLLFSPVPTLLAIGWLAITAARTRAGEYDRPSFYLALLAACLVFELSFFTKNIRYAVVLELPIRVFSVLMIGELVGRVRRVPAAVLTGLAVLLLCWLEWSTFDQFWVRGRLYDPVTALLGYLRHLVPLQMH